MRVHAEWVDSNNVTCVGACRVGDDGVSACISSHFGRIFRNQAEHSVSPGDTLLLQCCT